MTTSLHNALHQVTKRCGGLTLRGFSISGLATYLQVPELDLCFDMGECPLSALPLRHIFLTHAHGDHARCILRHRALRAMVGIAGEPTYFMPSAIADDFLALAKAEARFEGVPDDIYRAPTVTALDGDETLVPFPYRKGLWVRAFPVDHRGVPSLGYTIVERRQKLAPQYAHLAGAEIAALRKDGVDVSLTTDVPLLTFIGDCVASTLREASHIWQSRVLVLEATFVDPDDREMADAKGHTHLDEIGEVIGELGVDALPEHIVLKHFSMKVSREAIAAGITRAIPEFARDRIVLFLD